MLVWSEEWWPAVVANIVKHFHCELANVSVYCLFSRQWRTKAFTVHRGELKHWINIHVFFTTTILLRYSRRMVCMISWSCPPQMTLRPSRSYEIKVKLLRLGLKKETWWGRTLKRLKVHTDSQVKVSFFVTRPPPYLPPHKRSWLFPCLLLSAQRSRDRSLSK